MMADHHVQDCVREMTIELAQDDRRCVPFALIAATGSDAGTIIHATSEFSDLVGLTEAELIGMLLAEFIHPEDRDRADLAHIGRVTNGSLDGVVRLVDKLGEPRWINLHISIARQLRPDALIAWAIPLPVRELPIAEHADHSKTRTLHTLLSTARSDRVPAGAATTT